MSSIREDLGDTKASIYDRLSAWNLCDSASYFRYAQELRLGDLFEKASKPEEAEIWYLKALNTALACEMSGGSSVLSLFLLKGSLGGLTEDQRDLCKKVVDKSWSFLRIPGQPNLDDLEKTARSLVEAESRPLPRE